jgi:ferredoxin
MIPDSGTPARPDRPGPGHEPAKDVVNMPHIIAQPCIGTKDTACVAVCPVDCIHPTKDEPAFAAAEMLYIDPDTCIDCGLCVDECPVKAIFPEEDLPSEWQAFVAKNATFYKK